MRLTTWNVNGIRNPFGYAPWNAQRTFPAMFDILEADIVVMQELKIQRKDLSDDMVLLDGWDCYFSLPKQKKGYSGVGIYTRNATCAPIRAEEGVLGVLSPPNTKTAFRDLPDDQHIGGYPSELQIIELGVDPMLLDSEGRCVCLEFPAFVLFGVYSPANSNGLRDDFRYGFLCALECRIRNLIKMGKRVVLVGDLNVSRSEMDSASSIEDMRKAGITHDEYISTPNRRVFNQLIVGGEWIGERDEGREVPILCDLVRDFHHDRQGMYTHWEQKINARPGNFGSRIDYVLASTAMQDWYSEANIQEGLMGSDHCPVYGIFKDVVTVNAGNENAEQVHLIDIMNPPGVFHNGSRQKQWTVKDIPATSGKLMPEFDKRRSIKDMFKQPALPRAPSSTQATSPPQDGFATVNGTEVAAAVPPQSPTAFPNANGRPAAISSPVKLNLHASPSNGMEKKRKAPDISAAKTVKRQKSGSITTATKAEPPKGQKSLKGFFAAKPKPAAESHDVAQPPANPVRPSDNGAAQKQSAEADTDHDGEVAGNSDSHSAMSALRPLGGETYQPPDDTSLASELYTASQTPTKPEPPAPPSPSVQSTDGSVHDPIVSKESWSTLFRKPAVPMCEHGEPCKSMLTKKKGENQGRSFYMCTRPLGPSGAKEKNTQWRCSTFIWCSDWKGDG